SSSGLFHFGTKQTRGGNIRSLRSRGSPAPTSQLGTSEQGTLHLMTQTVLTGQAEAVFANREWMKTEEPRKRKPIALSK
ncbi:hypothetical protein LEMLEM_LOCUS5453, partial [Lemmus lemmus]